MDSERAATVLVSGSSGLIGSALLPVLATAGLRPIRLVRREPAGPDDVRWTPEALEPVNSADLARLECAAAAVHLCGVNIAAQRWTPAYKNLLSASRVGSTRALIGVLRQLHQPPRALLSASAVGFYGNCGNELLDESAAPGTGFLAGVCRALEDEAMRAADFGVRVAPLRIGMVLARQGGALPHMLPIFRAGLGGPLGGGRQWGTWIALSDLTRAVLHVLKTESLSGPVNVVAPSPITSREFARALGHALHRPALLPTPAFALRLMLGQMAEELLLTSARVTPARLVASGFGFKFPEISDALQALL